MVKAIRFDKTGGPEVMKWVDVEVGEPAAGEIRIRQTAVGLNYIDVYFRTGLYPLPLPGGLGMEAAGEVTAVGAGVSAVAPGDVVFCANSAPCGVCRQCVRERESLCEDLLYLLGGFAEKLLIPERVVEKNLHPLPPGVPLGAGLGLGRAAAVGTRLGRLDLVVGHDCVLDRGLLGHRPSSLRPPDTGHHVGRS